MYIVHGRYVFCGFVYNCTLRNKAEFRQNKIQPYVGQLGVIIFLLLFPVRIEERNRHRNENFLVGRTKNKRLEE